MSETWTVPEAESRSSFYLVPPAPMGLRPRPWTHEEEETVRTHYPDYGAIGTRLPHRSYSSLRSRAERLGLRPKRHVWTQLEVARLKRVWSQRRPTDETLRATFAGFTLTQILAKAHGLGLVRERRAPKVLGVAVLDAVRQRAHDEGMTMRDLDVVSGTRRYFQQTVRRVVWRHVAAGVEALGGRLIPSWDEDAEPGRDALVFGYKPADNVKRAA